MRHVIANPHASVDIYVNESDMSFWKVVMTGPAKSPYENGTFVLFVHMTTSYPQSAPSVRLIIPILHPNITKVNVSSPNASQVYAKFIFQHGRICHQILSDGWKSSFHIFNVLQNIYGLLASPEVRLSQLYISPSILTIHSDR